MRSKILPLITAFLCCTPVKANSPDDDLKSFLRLAADPHSYESFGFESVEEVASARLGAAYGIWSKSAWLDQVDQYLGDAAADPDLAEDKIYEVLGENGQIRCTFAFARYPDGNYRPIALSTRSVEALQQLRDMPDRRFLAIIIDAGRLLYADARTPEQIREFSGEVSNPRSGPPGTGFIPGAPE